MKTQIFTGALALVLFGNTAVADERPDHYEGKPSDTLEEALANLEETNALIAELLADETMTPEEHARLHQLTYTAENALAKISEEIEAVKASLEEVHLASERVDSETVLDQAPTYLDQSQSLFGE